MCPRRTTQMSTHKYASYYRCSVLCTPIMSRAYGRESRAIYRKRANARILRRSRAYTIACMYIHTYRAKIVRCRLSERQKDEVWGFRERETDRNKKNIKRGCTHVLLADGVGANVP